MIIKQQIVLANNMNKIKSFLVLGIFSIVLSSCDQLNSAYLVNDTSDSVVVVLSIINLEKVQNSFPYRNLADDSTANIYKLDNETTRIEFALCSKCEFELFFDTAPLRAFNLSVDTLKILKSNETLEYNTKEQILNAFVEREHYTKRYLTIKE